MSHSHGRYELQDEEEEDPRRVMFSQDVEEVSGPYLELSDDDGK